MLLGIDFVFVFQYFAMHTYYSYFTDHFMFYKAQHKNLLYKTFNKINIKILRRMRNTWRTHWDLEFMKFSFNLNFLNQFI